MEEAHDGYCWNQFSQLFFHMHQIIALWFGICKRAWELSKSLKNLCGWWWWWWWWWWWCSRAHSFMRVNNVKKICSSYWWWCRCLAPGSRVRPGVHLLMLLTQVVVGSYLVVAKIALSGGVQQLVFAVYRDAFGICLLIPFAYFYELYVNNIFPWSTRLDLSWEPPKSFAI